jgi:predicted nucleic acid-binding protein
MSDPRTPLVFFDSNILIYSDDKRYPQKQRTAQSLIRSHRVNRTGVVSLQTLQEYFRNTTRKLGLDPATARRKVEIFSRFHLVEPVLNDVFSAIDLHRLHQISYWDAMVVHCAKKSGCQTVLTEDLNNGQMIDGVRIVNPFL